MQLVSLLVLFFVFAQCQGPCLGYDPGLYKGYVVIGVTPKTVNQVKRLHAISVNDAELDFWTDARRAEDEALIMVPPHKYKNMVKDLKDLGMEHKITIDDVESLLSKEKVSLEMRKRSSTGFDYDDFHTYDEIIDEMDVLASKCRGDLGIKCETYVIGQSYEGRDQKMLRVYIDRPNRRAYWMDSQIHAREWLAVATNLKIANHIITNYDSCDEARRLMDDGDWYFLFVHNPDGYIFSWTDDRLWRKNRFNNSETIPGTDCMGIDLNRNYEYGWGNAGTSDSPCSNIYKGQSPADQIEVQNVQKEIRRLAPSLKAFATIHTAARLILSPWGMVINPGANASDLICKFLEEPEQSDVDGVAKLMAKNIQEYFNHSSWSGGNSCDTIYPASGITQDYARGVGMIKYSFTPELRNEDANNTWYGFVPPASEINLSFLEMWTGFVTMVDAINGGNIPVVTEKPTDPPCASGGDSLNTHYFCCVFPLVSLLVGWMFI